MHDICIAMKYLYRRRCKISVWTRSDLFHPKRASASLVSRAARVASDRLFLFLLVYQELETRKGLTVV